jgi:hypothetical protein
MTGLFNEPCKFCGTDHSWSSFRQRTKPYGFRQEGQIISVSESATHKVPVWYSTTFKLLVAVFCSIYILIMVRRNSAGTGCLGSIWAQTCANRATIVRFQCQTAICRSSYVVTLTQPCLDTVCEAWNPVDSSCCGVPHTSLVPTGDPCLFTSLRDPSVRRRLLLVAEKQNILVPTCEGTFMPIRALISANQGANHP